MQASVSEFQAGENDEHDHDEHDEHEKHDEHDITIYSNELLSHKEDMRLNTSVSD